MDENGLEMMNRLKNERGKETNVKNTSRTQRVILPPNPRRHKEDSGPPFPLKTWFLHKFKDLWTSLSQAPKGRENPKKE
jgi:hypothetical protein